MINIVLDLQNTLLQSQPPNESCRSVFASRVRLDESRLLTLAVSLILAEDSAQAKLANEKKIKRKEAARFIVPLNIRFVIKFVSCKNMDNHKSSTAYPQISIQQLA
jgi:hypothetical protein